MTVTIELSQEQETQLTTAAEQEGITPSELAKRLLANSLLQTNPTASGQDPTLALFDQWEQEDANLTDDEISRERQLWEEFQQSINATRQAQGMRQL